MTQVVAFHVAPSRETTERIAGSCASFRSDNDYLALLDILFRSAALNDPTAQPTVLTDPATDMSPLEGRVRVIRSPIDPERVMFSRLLAQIDFLQHMDPSEPVMFVDSDMIVNTSFGALFSEDFDVALSYRDNLEMPINGGVILVKGGRQAAAIRFLRSVCDCYAARYAHQSHWWGDQRALIDVVDRQRFQSRTTDTMSVDGATIRLLPCDEYNFSPDDRPWAIARPLRSKAILHFKGERKRLMPLYWEAYLAAAESPGWRATWQAFKTRWKLRVGLPRKRPRASAPAGATVAHRPAA